MKKIMLLLGLTMALDRASAFPFFDPFADQTAAGGTSYTVGSDLGGQSDGLGAIWNSIGTGFPGTHPLIAAGNLSYANLPASSGNSVSFFPSTTGQQSVRLNFNSTITASTTRAYYSFKLKLTDISTVPTAATNNYFVCFSDGSAAQAQRLARAGTRVVVKQSGAGFLLGVGRNDTATDYVFDTNVYNVNDTVFIVGSYDKIGGTTNVNLWVNPPASSFGSNAAPAATASAVTFSTPGGDLSGNVQGFVISGQTVAEPTGTVDDLRIGTDWATVTGGPGIYASPTNQTRNAGTNATFTVAAFGGTPISYRWQKDGTALSNGGNISGATTATLTISNLLAADGAGYAAVVSNSYSMATSAVATLTVNDPWITVQPTNKAVNPGATTVLQVAAVGTPTLTYQWYKDSSPLSDGGHISGSLSSQLTISSFSSGDVGMYSVVVFNSLASGITSSNAFIGLTDPSITAQPQSITNIYGTTANFQVTASGTAPFKYQWHKAGFGDLSDGGNISGSHTNILTITGVASGDSGTYSVTVSNALGAWVDSAPAVLTVRDPAITTQPVSTTNTAGTTATFHAVAVGTPGLTYVWYKGVNILFDDGVKYSGASTDTLWITNVAAGDQDTYHLTVFNGLGASEDSVAVALTFVAPPTPITITAQPTPRKVLAGSQTVLAVGYTGSSPQFQWQHAGTNVPGATAAAYVLTNVQPALTGNYQLIITNSINAATSAPVTVSIVSSLRVYPTNVVVIRVGDGAQGLTTHGNSMFVDQWAPNGTYLTTMSLPDSGSNSVVAIGPTLTTTPSSVTGNGLSRSANGRYLVFGGYNTNLTFTNELQSTAATIVPRGIGLLDDQGQYTLAVSSTDTGSGNFWRGACYDGTNNYWGFSRTSSTYYFGFDAPGVVLTDWTNLRSMSIFNNRIYGVSAVAGKTGVMRLSGLPKTAETVEFVINTGSNFSSDCEVSPDGSLIYVADAVTTGGGGIQRWKFAGSTWNLEYTLTDGLPAGAFYVTADFSGANPVVYAVTTDADNNRIVRISDTGPGATGTVVAYAGVNQNFRGIRLAAASVGQPLLSLTRAPGAVILNWSGSFFLQSATNVTGPYTDVIGATAPYTNSTSGAQTFFRLRQ